MNKKRCIIKCIIQSSWGVIQESNLRVIEPQSTVLTTSPITPSLKNGRSNRIRTHIDGFGDRSSTVELYSYYFAFIIIPKKSIKIKFYFTELQRDIANVALGQANIVANQAQCCCETQRAIDGVNFNNAMNTASINQTTV